MTEFLANAQAIDIPQTLKDIASNARQDGMVKYVKLINTANALITGTLPEFTHIDVPYRYDINSTFSELAPAIYEPTDTVGRYIMISDRIVYQTVAPVAPPELSKVRYVALLQNPTRQTVWNSKETLQNTPVLDDWVPDDTLVDVTDPTTVDIATNAFPTFTPDFVGQRIRDTVTGLIFISRATAPLWILDTEYTAEIPTSNALGGDIPGDITLAITDHKQFRQLSNSANITLPQGLGVNIRCQLSHFEAIAGAATTITFTPAASTTVNGGVIAIASANANFDIWNIGDEWFVR